MTLGDRIQKVRGGLTQAEFGKKIGISQPSVRNYEQNVRKPDSEILYNICDFFLVSPEWLLTGKGPMYAEPETQKMADASAIFPEKKSQHIDIAGTGKKDMADASAISDPQKIEDVLNAGRVYQELITALKGNVLLQGEIGRLLEDKFQLQTKINGLQEDLLRQVKEKEQAKQELARMTEKMEQMQVELARQTKKTLASDAEAPAQSRHSAKYMGSVGSVISGDVHGGTFQIENKGK